MLEIPHFVLNLEEDFHQKVIAPFVQSYLNGTTPSPCILCNTHVKFDLLHRKAFAVGAEKVATGHYARITRDAEGRYELRKAVDRAKDQSYFLFELNQEQLRDALFPLGELHKPEVRRLAEEGSLSVARKKESYEICFVPQRDGYGAIVEREARQMQAAASGGGERESGLSFGSPTSLLDAVVDGEAGGDIVDMDGNVVGEHEGYYHFTVGQRRGLQLGGSAERTYVVEVNPFTRRVTVGPASMLEKSELVAERVHWISGRPPERAIEVEARVRSRMADVAATVEPLGGERAAITFAHKLRAIAPGQAVVFYQGDLCLGGGWITKEKVKGEKGRKCEG
jgi:tRNA-specific 2-thiouridylase